MLYSLILIVIDCQEMKIEYIGTHENGYEYRLQLYPQSCDLDASFVQDNLQATPKYERAFPEFSFDVTKQGFNLYRVNLLIQGSVMKSNELEVSLFYLKDTIVYRKIDTQKQSDVRCR